VELEQAPAIRFQAALYREMLYLVKQGILSAYPSKADIRYCDSSAPTRAAA
jgi:hypothetical protein